MLVNAVRPAASNCSRAVGLPADSATFSVRDSPSRVVNANSVMAINRKKNLYSGGSHLLEMSYRLIEPYPSRHGNSNT